MTCVIFIFFAALYFSEKIQHGIFTNTKIQRPGATLHQLSYRAILG